jgi:hypothetical protein
LIQAFLFLEQQAIEVLQRTIETTIDLRCLFVVRTGPALTTRASTGSVIRHLTVTELVLPGRIGGKSSAVCSAL